MIIYSVKFHTFSSSAFLSYSSLKHVGKSRRWTLQFTLNGKTYSTATKDLLISNVSCGTKVDVPLCVLVSGMTYTDTQTDTHMYVCIHQSTHSNMYRSYGRLQTLTV